ncbi:MAG: DUF58 domain-containing protein [Nanoarchaeota archaeon]|nr:DUF58 domain-containing protein [Nanoarchaeota archaeon]
MEELKIDVYKGIKKLELLTKELVSTGISGSYRSVFRGQGLEFEQYRNYTPSDDSRLIDWKASKRTGTTLMKQWTEERNLTAYFLLDVSSSMVFGSIKKLKNEYAAEFVGSLAYAMMDVGDSVGIGMFNDGIIKHIPPSRSKHQFYGILKSLSNPLFYGGGYNLASALKSTINLLDKGSVVFIVSDFINLTDEWQKNLEIASSKFDVSGIMIRDPLDRGLPEDSHQVIIEHPISEDQMLVVPDDIGERYEEYVQQQERMIKSAFLSRNCEFINLSSDKPFIEELIKFFKKKRKI